MTNSTQKLNIQNCERICPRQPRFICAPVLWLCYFLIDVSSYALSVRLMHVPLPDVFSLRLLCFFTLFGGQSSRRLSVLRMQQWRFSGR